jgi:hypothetical protein
VGVFAKTISLSQLLKFLPFDSSKFFTKENVDPGADIDIRPCVSTYK